MSSQAFQIEPGEVAGPISTPTGPAFITVIAKQDPYIPPIDEVRAEVREDVIRKKSLTLAQERAVEAVGELRDAENFVEAAEAAEFTVGSSDLVTRGASLPQVGINAAVETAAFSLETGEVSNVIESGNSATIVHLAEREDASNEELETNRDAIRNDLLFSLQNQFFGSYMENIKGKIEIDINFDILEQALNPV